MNVLDIEFISFINIDRLMSLSQFNIYYIIHISNANYLL